MQYIANAWVVVEWGVGGGQKHFMHTQVYTCTLGYWETGSLGQVSGPGLKVNV